MAENVAVDLILRAQQYVRGARDAARATDEIDRAADELRETFQQTAASADRAGDEIKASSQAARGGMSDTAKTAIGLSKALAGAYATKKVLDFSKAVISSSQNLNESINAVNVQFGEGRDVILDFGRTAAQQVGLANSTFNQLSVTTGALLKNFISDQREAAKTTIELTKRSADLASVYNTDVNVALEAAQAFIRGETEQARRFGVVADDMAVKLKAVELGLAGSTGEVDAAAKSQARLALFMEQTAVAAGDFAATSTESSNRQRIFAASLENTKAKLGDALIPALEAGLDLAEGLLPTIENLSPALSSVASGFVAVADAVQPVLGPLGSFLDLAGRGLSLFSEAAGSDVAKRANAIREAQDSINATFEDGGDATAAYANALAHVATQGRLTQSSIGALGDGIEFAGDQQGVAIASALELAKAERAAAEAITDTGNAAIDAALDEKVNDLGISITALEDALVQQIAATELTADAQQNLIDKYGLAEAAARAQFDPVGQIRQAYIDQANAVDAAREAQNNVSLESARTAARQREQRDAIEEAKTAWQRQTNAILENASALAEQSDPVLRLIRAQERVKEAQAELSSVQGDAEASSEDLRSAQLDLIQAQGDLESASVEAAGKIGDGAEAFFTLGEQAGLSRGEVSGLISTLGSIPSTISTRIVIETSRVTRPTESSRPEFRQFGGAVRANQEVVVGEVQAERFRPSVAGTIVPESRGGNVIHIHASAPDDLAAQVQEGLLLADNAEAVEFIGSTSIRG